MEKEKLIKRLLELFTGKIMRIKGNNKFNGEIARIDKNEIKKNDKGIEFLKELDIIIKSLLGVSAFIILNEARKKLIGILKAIGEGALLTQNMAVSQIMITTTSITFLGYCLNKEKKAPTDKTSLVFDENVEEYSDVNALFKVLSRDSYYDFIDLIDTKTLMNEWWAKMNNRYDDELIAPILKKISITEEIISNIDKIVKARVKDRFIQAVIWKARGDFTFLRMIEHVTKDILVEEFVLFAIKILDDTIPCNPSLRVPFTSELLISKYVELLKLTEMDLSFEKEKEYVEKGLDNYIVNRQKQYKEQVEIERNDYMTMEQKYLEMAKNFVSK